jgi:hypothetical protein
LTTIEFLVLLTVVLMVSCKGEQTFRLWEEAVSFDAAKHKLPHYLDIFLESRADP